MKLVSFIELNSLIDHAINLKFFAHIFYEI